MIDGFTSAYRNIKLLALKVRKSDVIESSDSESFEAWCPLVVLKSECRVSSGVGYLDGCRVVDDRCISSVVIGHRDLSYIANGVSVKS